MPNPTERVRLVVRGLVQGVGFRWHVARAAQGLALVGWVRNLPDGRVEVAAEGPAADLERLEKAVRDGPPAAIVENVEKTQLSLEIPIGKAFEIL